MHAFSLSIRAVPLVELKDVEKYYGDLHALKSVTLSLEAGRVGLLGPNGAGKSTFLKALLGLVLPTSGSIKVFDLEVARHPFEIRARIGYMPEGDHVMPELSALEYTTFAAKLCGLPDREAVGRAHLVLQYVGLGEARYRKLGSYSTGMRQRARLAQALVGDPKLLLLDEPTSGLDPRGRDEMLALIQDIPARTGASVILSTHILPDVEKTCDQVIVLAGGQALYAGALAPLIQAEEGTFEVRVKGAHEAMKSALELSQCVVTVNGSMLEVRVPAGAGAAHIVRVAVEAGVQLRHLAPLQHTLERAFFETLEKASSNVHA